jgi:lipopolysaccharide/colanic/teichoic acid biosynthesis glycosyltransferase
MKRFFDFFASLIGLIVLSPVFLILIILVRFFLGSPVLFLQIRPGIHGKPFTMYKFRTMRDIHDHNGQLLPDKFRLSCFGKWLRSTSLDELPELWNVMKGDMSLVGPRPLLMEYLNQYSVQQYRRHDVLPGITGWAQINGRNSLSWEKKFELDVWYVDNHSFKLDAKIILLTIKKVFLKEGINGDGESTVSKFTNNK